MHALVIIARGKTPKTQERGMPHTQLDPQSPADDAEPAWDIAKLFPRQGAWTESEYFALHGNRLVEFSNGHIEVLAMLTIIHQRIVALLYNLLLAFTAPGRLGEALFAPASVKLWPGKFRQPDIFFMLAQNASRTHDDYWEGADLVMEVVSDDDRRRDLETKRFEYAQAGIAEYWIVDPRERRVTVLALEEGRYREHGVFDERQEATSALLGGLAVNVGDLFKPRAASNS
jgi:Uma2 family endonuclease